MGNRKQILAVLLLFINFCGYAQLHKDLDNDGIKDSIDFDYDHSRITCRLSSQNYIVIVSRSIPDISSHAYIKATKNGFELIVPYMRGGFSNQFRYDKSTKQIRLIGMSRYEFGAGPNDGSGKSSVNLLTNNYIGDWNYFDYQKDKLIKIPTIKQKMYFTKQALQNYDGSLQLIYERKCSALYEKYKKKAQQR